MLVIFLTIISVTQVIEPALSAPIASNTSSPRVKRDQMSVADYLMSFGYIDKDAMSASNLRSGEDLKNALKSLQKIGHIPETGKMDAATVDLMSKPRCGMSDTPERGRERRYVHADTRWDHKEITWNLGRTPGHLRRDDLRRDVQRAFEVWARHSSLTFHERPGDQKADIQISFDSRSHGDQNAFDGRGMVLAHAFAPDAHQAIGGDTHFDADEDWTLEYRDNREGTHFFMVALHEFGHSLGLKHSEVTPSVMSPWYTGSDNNMLEEDDVVAIELLYGKNEGVKGGGRDPVRERPNHRGHPDRPSYQEPPPRYPPQGRPDYPPQARPDYPPQARPDYPPQARPDYPPQARPGYPPQPRPGYPPERRYPDQRYPPRERYPDRKSPDFRNPQRAPYETDPTSPSSTDRPISEQPESDNPAFACDISYDAISMVRGELFIFKDDLYWRVRIPNFERNRNPPSARSSLWKDMPSGSIDAVYERPNGDIVFFMGKVFYVYHGITLKNAPIPLSLLGLPPDLKKIDAATRYKEHTYLFSGKLYWRFDEHFGRVASGYPKKIAEHWGVDGDIDAALQWHDQHTYFFKGKHFGRYDEELKRVDGMLPAASYWMNCKGSAANTVPPAIGYFLLPLVLHVYRYLCSTL